MVSPVSSPDTGIELLIVFRVKLKMKLVTHGDSETLQCSQVRDMIKVIVPLAEL